MEFRWDSIDSDSARPFFGGCLCLDLANVADWDDPPRIMHFGFRFDEVSFFQDFLGEDSPA